MKLYIQLTIYKTICYDEYKTRDKRKQPLKWIIAFLSIISYEIYGAVCF